MSPAHKQRLVGAAVLVALFLIIVPTVLDFSRDERIEMEGVGIPPGPDVMQMEVLPLDEWSQRVEPEVSRDQAVEEAPIEAAAPPEPAPEAALPVAEPPPSRAVAPAPASASAPAPIAASAPRDAVADGWVVQVASLGSEARADELRDRLRKEGHSVTVEKGGSGSATVYRVKAGPVESRDEAELLKSRIKQATGLEGLVRQNR